MDLSDVGVDQAWSTGLARIISDACRDYGWNSEQILPYKLMGAPTYLLIDKKGEIVRTRAEGAESMYDEIVKLITD